MTESESFTRWRDAGYPVAVTLTAVDRATIGGQARILKSLGVESSNLRRLADGGTK